MSSLKVAVLPVVVLFVARLLVREFPELFLFVLCLSLNVVFGEDPVLTATTSLTVMATSVLKMVISSE